MPRQRTIRCFVVTGYEPYVALAEDLVALVPGAFEKKVVLANTGAEAVETAVKIARSATGRDAVIVIEPVAGEGGYIPAPPAFLQHVRALCDRIGAVLVLDELDEGLDVLEQALALTA
jgi:4-aminobutyrate aminotransferase-like enzyme